MNSSTSETHVIKLALRFVRRLYGPTAAAEFTPKKLKAVREAMVAHDITREVKVTDETTGVVTHIRKIVRTGMARKCVNKLVGRVKRMFAWAVEEELVAVAVHAALARVKGLKKGKSAARETPRVRPVPPEHVEKVLLRVPKAVGAMVEVQRLSGCRPLDVVQMRPCDIDRSGPVWEDRPPRFKTEHHNDEGSPDFDRVVYIGPKAQAVLEPLLPLDPKAHLFSPRRSEAERSARRRAERKSPLTPSQAARTRVARHRGRSSAHDRGRYRSASSSARRSPRASPTWTVTTPLSIFPAHPRYCRCTPGVLSPFLAQLVSSITPTVPRSPAGNPSATAASRRWRWSRAA